MFRFQSQKLRSAEIDVKDAIGIIDESQVLLVNESLPMALDADPTIPMDAGDAMPHAVADMLQKEESQIPLPEQSSDVQKPDPKHDVTWSSIFLHHFFRFGTFWKHIRVYMCEVFWGFLNLFL